MKIFRRKKGFTLAELLIVLAIIAVLTAIAVPLFSTQIDKAREAVDEANARSASSMAEAHYLMNHIDETGPIIYYFKIEGNNLVIAGHSAPSTSSAGYEDAEKDCKLGGAASASEDFAQSKKYSGKPLTVTVEDGKITNSWLDGE